MSRRPMKPWEVLATLIANNQLHVAETPGGGYRALILCPRTGKEITLENVRSIQCEHWPERHVHGGEIDPKNALVSLAEGHKAQTKREQKADAKERRIAAKRHREIPISKPKYRLKKKLSGAIVKVRTK